MCGIVGCFGDAPDEAWVNSVIVDLIPRGPDHQETSIINPSLVMGAARLAMTDPLPRSNQPFLREDLGIAITFNGEIYNYKELRFELAQLGYTFRTDSDTEVLLLAIHKYGKNVTAKLNGMYAFAYFSNSLGTLLLGRDSLGKKPLYYSFNGSTFLWSSSLESINKKRGSEISDYGLNQYFAFGYTIDPDTILEKIHAIKPGELIEISKTGKRLELTKFLGSPYVISPSESRLSTRDSIFSAVESRVDGHANVAISLSGGLDSSIVAFIAKELGKSVTGYSAVWPHSDKARYNEDAKRARMFAEKIGIGFREVEMFPPTELEANLSEFVSALEEPNANPTGVSMMCLYRAISEDGFRLVLTGDGADEIFGGYPRYKSQALLPNFLKLNNAMVSGYMARTRNGIHQKFSNLLSTQLSAESHHKWSHWHWNMTPGTITQLRGRRSSKNIVDKQMQESIQRFQTGQTKSDVNTLMKLDKDLWLAMESNRKLDRISMSYSIEARSPFQDERVIYLGDQAPSIVQSKEFEKESLWRAFPEMKKLGVRSDKTGFISPVGHWLRGNKELVNNLANQATSRFELNSNYVSQLIQSPSSGNYRDFMNLWSIIVLSAWEANR